MTTTFSPSSLSDTLRRIGRALVYRAPVWDRSGPLSLTLLGDTEGDIVPTEGTEVAYLTLPERTGPAPHEADVTGHAPTIAIPIFLTDPTLLAIFSPHGSASGGASMRQLAAEHTIVLIPEEAVRVTDQQTGLQTQGTLQWSNGAWTLNGTALPAANANYLDLAFWAWRCVLTRDPLAFLGGAGDESKNIVAGTATLMHHDGMPNGHKLWTRGDPADAGISLDGES